MDKSNIKELMDKIYNTIAETNPVLAKKAKAAVGIKEHLDELENLHEQMDVLLTNTQACLALLIDKEKNEKEVLGALVGWLCVIHEHCMQLIGQRFDADDRSQPYINMLGNFLGNIFFNYPDQEFEEVSKHITKIIQKYRQRYQKERKEAH